MTTEELLHLLHEQATTKQLQLVAELIIQCFAQRNMETLQEIAIRIAQLTHRVESNTEQAARFSYFLAQITTYTTELKRCQRLDDLIKELEKLGDQKFYFDILRELSPKPTGKGKLSPKPPGEYDLPIKFCRENPEFIPMNYALISGALETLERYGLVEFSPGNDEQGRIVRLTQLGKDLHKHLHIS